MGKTTNWKVWLMPVALGLAIIGGLINNSLVLVASVFIALALGLTNIKAKERKEFVIAGIGIVVVSGILASLGAFSVIAVAPVLLAILVNVALVSSASILPPAFVMWYDKGKN